MVCFGHALLFFFVTALATIDARSVQQNSIIDLRLNNLKNNNRHLSGTIASYRHRFEHSPNFKALRWALDQQITPPYCEFCRLFVPVVNLIYFYTFMLHCFSI
jgi:hypothetical protein